MTLSEPPNQAADGYVQIGCDARGVDGKLNHIFNLDLSTWVDIFGPATGGISHNRERRAEADASTRPGVSVIRELSRTYQRRSQCM